MNCINQILLDLDGPLLDGKTKHYHCYRTILEKFEFKPIGFDEYWERKRNRENRRILLNMSGAEEIYDDFLSSWLDLIESPEMLALDKLQEGAVDCLRTWKEHGFQLNLVTMRRNSQATKEQLIKLKLSPLLDAVLVSNHDDGGFGKAEAVRRMFPGKLFTEHALWIGDTEADWDAAKSLGCGIVLLSNGLRNEAYLKTLDGAVVRPSIALIENEVLRN